MRIEIFTIAVLLFVVGYLVTTILYIKKSKEGTKMKANQPVNVPTVNCEHKVLKNVLSKQIRNKFVELWRCEKCKELFKEEIKIN